MNRLTLIWMAICAAVGVMLAESQLLEIPYRSALRGYDNTFNYLWLRSAAVDHDWDFRNDLEQCNTLTPDYRAAALALPRTATGRVPNKYGVGWAVLTAPFYAAADAIVSVGGWLGWTELHRDGFNPVYQGWIVLGHVAIGLFGLWLAVHAVAGWVGDRIAATAGVVAVWSASSLLYYQTADVAMSHGAAFFAVAMLAFALVRAAQRPLAFRWWWLAGTALGLAMVTRFQLGVFAVPLLAAVWRPQRAVPGSAFGVPGPEREGQDPLVERDSTGAAVALGQVEGANETGAGGKEQGAWAEPEPLSGADGVAGVGDPGPGSASPATTAGAQARNFEPGIPEPANTSLLVRVALISLGAAPFFLLQAWAWRVVYGRWFVFSYGAEGESFRWTNPQFLQSLGSPWHGLLYWHPFVFVGLVGLVAWSWREWRVAAPWLVAAGITLYVNAAWWCWWFASAFGSRSFDAALLPVMGGAAWLLARGKRRWRTIWWVLAISAGLWNFYVVLLYRSGAISRSEPVTWMQMIQAAGRLPEAMQF